MSSLNFPCCIHHPTNLIMLDATAYFGNMNTDNLRSICFLEQNNPLISLMSSLLRYKLKT